MKKKVLVSQCTTRLQRSFFSQADWLILSTQPWKIVFILWLIHPIYESNPVASINYNNHIEIARLLTNARFCLYRSYSGSSIKLALFHSYLKISCSMSIKNSHHIRQYWGNQSTRFFFSFLSFDKKSFHLSFPGCFLDSLTWTHQQLFSIWQFRELHLLWLSERLTPS